MYGRNIAGTINQALQSTLNQPVEIVGAENRIGEGIQDAIEGYRKTQLINALKSGDKEEINKQLADYDPQKYADIVQEQERRAEERQWALDDTKNKQDFQRELLDAQYKNALNLEGVRNANARSLAEFKAGLDADNPDTNAQRNVASMIEAGYSPQEAWAMYYGGNNPTLNMETLGKKGQEAFDKAQGEALAKKETLERNLPSLTEMTNELIDLADKATYTPAGQGRDAFRRFFDLKATEGAKAREKYKQTVANELLPKLRETYGGQLSDSEREALLSTLGNVNMSGEEKKQAVKAFIEAKQRQINSYNQPSLKNFNQIPSDEDAWGGI